MKSIIIFLVCIGSASILTSAQPSIQWQKSFGGSGYDYAASMVQTKDRGFVIAGVLSSIYTEMKSSMVLNFSWMFKTSGRKQPMSKSINMFLLVLLGRIFNCRICYNANDLVG